MIDAGSPAATPPAGGAGPERRPALALRLAAFAVLFVLVNLAANLARVGLEGTGAPPLLARAVFTALYVGGVVAVARLCRTRLDRRPWADLGLQLGGGWPGQAATGLLLGAGLAGLMLGLQVAFGWVHVAGVASGTDSLALAVDAVLAGIAFGTAEEVCFRGYLFRNLAETRPLWQATAIAGVLFGAIHLTSVGLGLRGLTFFLFLLALHGLLVLMRLRTGLLWMAIGFHTAFDAVAIVEGLGSVVLVQHPVLVVQRLVPTTAEDVLGLLLTLPALAWLLRRTRHLVDWRSPLTATPEAEAVLGSGANV